MDEVKLLPCEELVERVAIKCHHASCANVPRHNPDYDRTSYPWKHCPTPAKDAWRAIARAAIEATRPTLVTDELVERLTEALDRIAALESNNPKVATAENLLATARSIARSALAAMPTLGTGQLEEGDLTERLERVERQFASGNGSYEAPSGKIMFRIWVTDLAAVLKLARSAHPQPGPSQ